MAPGADPFLASSLSREYRRKNVRAMASEPRVVLVSGAVRFPLMCPNCGAPAQRTLEVKRALQTFVHDEDSANENIPEIRSYAVPFCESCIQRHFNGGTVADPLLAMKRIFGGSGVGEALGAAIILLVALFFAKEAILQISIIPLIIAIFPGAIGSFLLYRNWRRNEFMSVAPASDVTSAVEFTPDLSLDFEPAWRAFRFRNGEFAEQFRRLNTQQIWDPQGEHAQEARAQRRRKTARKNKVMLVVIGVLLAWGLWSEYGHYVLDLIDRLR